MQTHQLTFSASELRRRLASLQAERALAHLEGLSRNAAYAEDLLDELQAVEAAFVGAAITEIASLRAQLDGPLHG